MNKKSIQFLKIVFVSLSLASCSSPSKQIPEMSAPGGIPQETASAMATGRGSNTGYIGPTDIDSEKKIYPVVLVVGPGFARSFAAAGVLKALHEAQVPVGAVFGTGMGALIAALYAHSKSINEFEWSLLKLKDKLFEKKRFDLGNIFRDLRDKGGGNKEWETTLQKVLGGKHIEQARIPLRIGIRLPDNNSFELLEHGNTAEAVRAALGDGQIYPLKAWEGKKAETAEWVRPFPIDEARRLAVGPVILVDLIQEKFQPRSVGSSERQEEELESSLRVKFVEAKGLANEEADDADLILRPELNDIGYLEFGKISTALFRGKQTAESKIAEIRALIGFSKVQIKGESRVARK